MPSKQVTDEGTSAPVLTARTDGRRALMQVVRRVVRRYAIWAVAAILALNAGRLSRAGGTPESSENIPGSSAPTISVEDATLLTAAKIIPHTVVLQETLRGTAQSPRPASVLTRAVRSDGAWMQRLEYLAPNAANIKVAQRLMYFPDGRRIDLDDIREYGFATRTDGRDSRAALRDPQSRCLQSFLGVPRVTGQQMLGEEFVGGLTAVKIKIGGNMHWFVPDLGCAEVRTETLVGEGVSDQVVTIALTGEPDASLFAVPPHYNELPPSLLYRVRAGSKLATRYDDWYRNLRIPLLE